MIFLRDSLCLKQFCIRYGYWDTRSDYGFRWACVFIKIHKYVASSRHQLIRRPTIIASLQDADFVYYSFKNVSISSKKTDTFSLPCNFMWWTRRIDRLCFSWNNHMASSLSKFGSHVVTGRNRMFPYFWNVAETCGSMVPLYLRLAETWKFKSAWFRHVSGTEMSSHVSVIFKPAHFRCCSFPSCFC